MHENLGMRLVCNVLIGSWLYRLVGAIVIKVITPLLQAYQWYAPPSIPRENVGERREVCHQNLPQGVGT